MQNPAKYKENINYRAKVTLWFSITSLLLLTPFMANNLIQGRYLLGTFSLIIVTILALHAWTITYKSFMPILTFAGLVPAIIIFLALAFHRQGMIAALWCYPAAIGFYFLLSWRQAIFASLALMLTAIPTAWFILEPALTTRFAVTLFGSCVFTAIFVYIIERQQRELEQKEAQRSDSMASASHELRTPLATLMAQIEAMRDGIRPLEHSQLASISLSTDHLSKLVDDLYLLTLADASALAANKGPERWDNILNEAVSATSVKLSDRNLSLKTSIETPVWVNGDAKCLRQIIDNLLENCYRYTQSDGEITVTLKRGPTIAELTVTDTGPGVSDEALSRLFDRFYRVERSRSRQMGGTGLGLSLVKALAEAHGGETQAFHAPEGGLGITVKIPLLPKPGKKKTEEEM